MIEFIVTFDNGSTLYLTKTQKDYLVRNLGPKGYFIEGIESRDLTNDLKRHNREFSSLVGIMSAKAANEGDHKTSFIEDLFEGLNEILD